MAIYGEEPASDSLALVVCQQCGRVVKSQALSKHKGEIFKSKIENFGLFCPLGGGGGGSFDFTHPS